MLPMIDIGHNVLGGSAGASELVGNHHPWITAISLHQFRLQCNSDEAKATLPARGCRCPCDVKEPVQERYVVLTAESYKG
jgi:hypothetical protein